MPDVNGVLDAHGALSPSVARRRGAAAAITDVVNIGIGGSDLGPAMATLALAPYHDGPRAAFRLQRRRRAYRRHAEGARPRDDAVPHRLQDLHHHRDHDQCRDGAALDRRRRSARRRSATISPRSRPRSTRSRPSASRRTAIFGFWDWVGGRYSIWSADRPAADDRHRAGEFRPLPRRRAMRWTSISASAPLAENLPVLLAWSASGTATSAAIRPARDHSLRPAPVALPRLSAAARHGIERQARDASTAAPSTRATGPIVWGEPGTNGQHAFFQLLHQGTDVIPVEFLIAAERPRAGHGAPPRRC